MTVQNTLLQQQAEMVHGILNRVDEISRNAAVQDDSGRWGLDGWIRTMHDLIDLQIRSYAMVVQAAIVGPSVWLRPPAGDPRPSEKVPLGRPTGSCTAEIVEVTQVGRPGVAVSKSIIGVRPVVADLAPNEAHVEVYFTDDRFVGANYAVKLRLINTADPSVEGLKEVIVGL